MKLFKLTIIFMLIFLGLSCAAQNEVQIKSYEDYFLMDMKLFLKRSFRNNDLV